MNGEGKFHCPAPLRRIQTVEQSGAFENRSGRSDRYVFLWMNHGYATDFGSVSEVVMTASSPHKLPAVIHQHSNQAR
ncbi:protein of unknown function [Caballeronia sp. S22]